MNKIISLIISMILVITLYISCSNKQTVDIVFYLDVPNSNFAAFRGCHHRTGVLKDVIPDYQFELAWRFKTGDEVFSSPVVYNDNCYITSLDGILYALDVYSGEELWRFVTGGPIYSTPSSFDGRLYFGLPEQPKKPLIYGVSANFMI